MNHEISRYIGADTRRDKRQEPRHHAYLSAPWALAVGDEPKGAVEAPLHDQAGKLAHEHPRRVAARARRQRGLALLSGQLTINGEESLYI